MKTIAYEEYEPWLAQDPRVYLMYTARARELQSEAIGNALGTAGRFLAGTAAGANRRIADSARKRQTIAQLSRLDDHMLADIGIDREHIPMIAQGLIAPSGEGAGDEESPVAHVPCLRRQAFRAPGGDFERPHLQLAGAPGVPEREDHVSDDPGGAVADRAAAQTPAGGSAGLRARRHRPQR